MVNSPKMDSMNSIEDMMESIVDAMQVEYSIDRIPMTNYYLAIAMTNSMMMAMMTMNSMLVVVVDPIVTIGSNLEVVEMTMNSKMKATNLLMEKNPTNNHNIKKICYILLNNHGVN